MAARELKVVVLIPVLEGQGGERRGISKLEIGEVPVEDLTVSGREVYITGGEKREEKDGKIMKNCFDIDKI